MFVCPDINSDRLPKHEWEGRIRHLVELIAETDEIHAAILAIKSLNGIADAQNCLRTIEKCFTDIVLHPDDDLYRQLFSEDLKKHVLDVEGGRRMLEAAGFEAVSIDGDNECFVFLSPDPEFLLDVIDLMNTTEGLAFFSDSSMVNISSRSGSSGVSDSVVRHNNNQSVEIDCLFDDDIGNLSSSNSDLSENIDSSKVRNKTMNIHNCTAENERVNHISSPQILQQNDERQDNSKPLFVEKAVEKEKDTNPSGFNRKTPYFSSRERKSTMVKAALPKSPLTNRANRRTVYNVVNHNKPQNNDNEMRKQKRFTKQSNKNVGKNIKIKACECLNGGTEAGLGYGIVRPLNADVGTLRASSKSSPILPSTKVRVRLPEGGVVEGDFAIDDILGSVRQLLNEKPEVRYTLHRTNGERILDEDFHKSFRQLGLCGSLLLRLRWTPSAAKNTVRNSTESEQTLEPRGISHGQSKRLRPVNSGNASRRFFKGGSGERTVQVSVQTPGRDLAKFAEKAKTSVNRDRGHPRNILRR